MLYLEKNPVTSIKTGNKYMVYIYNDGIHGYSVSLNVKNTKRFWKYFMEWKEVYNQNYSLRLERLNMGLYQLDKFGFKDMASSIVKEYEDEVERKNNYIKGEESRVKEFNDWDGEIE